MCLAPVAIGRVFRLYEARPGAELNEIVTLEGWLATRADEGRNDVVTVEHAPDEQAKVAIVRIDGPIEQRADTECGWWDGHDAIAERMIAALETAPVVLLMIDSPGGAVAGLQEAVRRVQEVKTRTGGRIVAFADEMIASGGYWWAACTADEIYGPQAMTVGSIGARAAHVSIAGMLAKDGVTITEFSQPEGKIALTETMPLSELGKARGEREVNSIFEQFVEAVSSHRPSLTRDAIVALNGDMLRGQDAVNAGLVDGVSTLEEVTEYALALAGNEGDEPMATKPGIRAEETPEKKEETADEPPPEKKEDKADAEPEPKDKPEPEAEGEGKTCGNCDAKNDADAKFCDSCGEPLEKKEEAASDEPPPEKKEEDGDKKPESRAAAATYAGLLGLKAGASHPAIKTALMAHVACSRKAMALTATDSPAAATGAIQAMADHAAKVPSLEEQLRASAKREEYRSRNDLLTKLAASGLPGCSRGDLFVDKVTADGKRITSPAPLYATTPIETLRGFVDAKLAGKGPSSVRNPFEPDPKGAKAASKNAQLTELGASERVSNISARTGIPSDRVAGSLAALQESGAIAGEDR